MPNQIHNAILLSENKAAEFRYRITVKVDADGNTTVTLKHSTFGHTFVGFASKRESNGYLHALNNATARMVAYETRLN